MDPCRVYAYTILFNNTARNTLKAHLCEHAVALKDDYAWALVKYMPNSGIMRIQATRP